MRPWCEGARGEIGLVLYNRDELATVCEFVRDHGGWGGQPIIAVQVGDEATASAWPLLRAGVADATHITRGESAVSTLAARIERRVAVDEIMRSRLIRDHIIGRSRAWRDVLRQLVEVARFASSSVLIEGESGTGKELLARLIHTLDPRPDKRELVLLDCTTLVSDLSGSEFFGHERGAFTGAVGTRDGVFAMADGGTLFLDEVGELPLPLQAQLLRAIQERTYKRVGGNAWHRVDFRLVCATNRDLKLAVERGEFRRDLYYRIAGWRCTPPPLRERHEDILPLAEHFLAAALSDRQTRGFDPQVSAHLQRRAYPGNVRDLLQLVQRIACRHVGDGPITPGSLPIEEWPEEALCGDWVNPAFEQAVRRALGQGASLKEIGRVASDVAVRIAMEDAEGNVQRAARQLGVTDRALQLRRASRRSDADPLDA